MTKTKTKSKTKSNDKVRCNACLKVYKHISSFYRHRDKCKKIIPETEIETPYTVLKDQPQESQEPKELPQEPKEPQEFVEIDLPNSSDNSSDQKVEFETEKPKKKKKKVKKGKKVKKEEIPQLEIPELEYTGHCECTKEIDSEELALDTYNLVSFNNDVIFCETAKIIERLDWLAKKLTRLEKKLDQPQIYC